MNEVGGLMNATEMIIAILAVGQRKMRIVKLSLLGSIFSNLLFILGTSLLFGGVSNLRKHQSFDRVRYTFSLTFSLTKIDDMYHLIMYLYLSTRTETRRYELHVAVSGATVSNTTDDNEIHNGG